MGHTVSKAISILVKPCSLLIGKIPSCCYNKISDTDIQNLSSVINSNYRPGDFILSHIDNRPTNLFFGGAPYTHLGVMTRNGYIIDMVSSGVRKTNIKNWLRGKDRIMIVRANILTIQETKQIISFCEEIYQKNTPYDFSFEIGSDAIYCTELAYLAIRSIDVELPVKLGLIPSVGGLLQSTTFRANSFIKSLELKKIIPIIEWRYEDGIHINNIDIKRLLDETTNPLEVNEKSRFLFELTKLAHPFNKKRVVLIQKNQSIKKSCFPSRKLSNNRSEYNLQPTGDLEEIINENFPVRVFRDTNTYEVYVVVSQRSNLLHCPCKWTKLVSFDAVHGIPEALGSVEIFVPNYIMKTSLIPKNLIKKGSYNYRDMYIAGKYDHYCLDIFGCM